MIVMKQMIFSLVVFGCVFTATAQIPVPNGSFEAWVHEDITVAFPPYSSLSNNLAASDGEPPNVYPVIEANGREAVRLEAGIVSGDSMAASMGIGSFFPNTPGAAWAGQPDSLRAWLRYDISPGDNALLAFHFFSGGSQIGANQLFFLTGTDSSWHEETFAFTPLPMASDSIGVLIVAGDFNGAVPGTWLELDSIALVGGPSLPNAGFDVIDSIGYTDPEGWLSPNDFSAVLKSTPIATQSNDAADGMYALRIETVETDTGNGLDTAGFVFLAQEIGDNGPEGGIPLPAGAEAPIRLNGQYQYHPTGNDTAIAYLVLTRYDQNLGKRDTVGEYGISLPPSSSYTDFEILTPVTADADSFMLAFGSSDFDGDLAASQIGIGSWLLLDELVFDTTAQDTMTDGLFAAMPALALAVYPNPVSGWLTVNAGNTQSSHLHLQVTDLQGRTWLQQRWNVLTQPVIRVNMVELPTGTYLMICLDPETGSVYRQKIRCE